MNKGVYYSEYLQLDKILGAQLPESDKAGEKAHDEMLFIIIHQAYELWFKQVMFEVTSVNEILSKKEIPDNSPDLYVVLHRLKRVIVILRLLIDQISIMETMTPLDFLDFRNLLRPASGFQSIQFKLLEAALGLKMDERHGKQYYISQLNDTDREKVMKAEETTGLIDLIGAWLERMPFFDKPEYWNGEQDGAANFWNAYASAYENSLQDMEKFHLNRFMERLLNDDAGGGRLSARARRAALFIMLYRDYPLFQLPFELLNILLEIDECLATWRYRHMHMVHRVIGTRSGTGGSSGKEYLQGALEKHYVFSEFAELTSFLIERKKLPKLSEALRKKLGFESD
ncbi:MAG: tryptophan 2,3-dioxygenase family protein [Chitinophagales bacterium]